MRSLVAAAALIATATGSGFTTMARAEPGQVFPDDRVLGAADAPVTIIEYSSLTCPHCARFHEAVLPKVKEQWVAAGKARLVYRHFPLDGLALRAALVADCLEGDRYFGFLDALFRSQQGWSRSNDPLGAIAKIAKLAGMNQDTFDACVSDEAQIDRILARAQDAKSTYGVNSTPTLIVNGRKVPGGVSYEEFEMVLEQAESKS